MSQDIQFRLTKVALKSGYSIDAVKFVFDAIAPSVQTQFVSAKQYCDLFRRRMIVIHDTKSLDVLDSWSCKSTSDVGKIFFELVDAGLIEEPDSISADDFESLFDFQTAFDSEEIDSQKQSLNQKSKKRGRGQLSILELFVLTTIAAVIFAGLASAGIGGIVVSIYTSWLTLIGIICISFGVRERKRDSWLQLLIGVAFLAMGLSGFYFVLT